MVASMRTFFVPSQTVKIWVFWHGNVHGPLASAKLLYVELEFVVLKQKKLTGEAPPPKKMQKKP